MLKLQFGPAILLFALSFMPVVKLSAQNEAQKIDEVIKAYQDMHEFSGTALVMKKGKIIFQKAYGTANRETGTPNTIDTKFRIGSVTKQFTAMLIMQLKEQGKLNLQDPISRYLPYYRKDVGNQVTIHQLLTHTSGIPDFTRRPNFTSEIAVVKLSREEMVKKYCSDTLESEPGKVYSYCNSGYYILGAIIESITGKSYGNVLQERIFNVVGMKNSGIDNPFTIVKNRAIGYDNVYGDFTNSTYINMESSVLSAGAIYSTVGDLMLWNKALHSNKLLSAENTEIMFTPYLNKYAYGIGVNKFIYPGLNREVTFHAHTGGIFGFRAVLLYETQNDELITLLSNLVDDNSMDLDPITNRIFAIINNIPYDKPKPSVVSHMGELVVHQSLDTAIAFYRQAKVKLKEKYDFGRTEDELNSLGYYLLNHKRVKDAVQILKLVTEEFPQSWNAYDSYAESLALDNQTPAAVTNYKKSLDLNPENANATKQLKMLENK
ncbi:class A beta-lactamase-related serine hydrolase [Chitinophaga silvatica]|uniref:Class A beta-lactamase-related serine hydrolase n=1 Tax=Chitinophaga silvatica TaxID=2282649 RepID=A0A3E1Y5Z7_9BACT|nr:serine hydrolase domain-containing protein [Chitinophaga silvatica]RFS20151.1 class A beta-lactamase-related serine hydrolase [Chitinophaga silvatica]